MIALRSCQRSSGRRMQGGLAMKARKLLDNAALGREQLEIVYAAFDAAWDAIKARYGDDKLSIEGARLRLADAALTAYRNGIRDSDALRDTAIMWMER